MVNREAFEVLRDGCEFFRNTAISSLKDDEQAAALGMVLRMQNATITLVSEGVETDLENLKAQMEELKKKFDEVLGRTGIDNTNNPA